MARVCRIGPVFHRCRRPGIATCQYCGREFCAVHTGLRNGGDEICSRETCLAKHADLKAHLVYRAAATERSNRGFCGTPACEGQRAGQCSKCHALFCEKHLHDRQETVRHGMVVMKRPVSLCDHCAGRIKLWAKV